ncbi:MAG: hypothetical protein IPL65_12295 [Lewinellaceae bacterium]|nr:hypothetical protein [Lewinellaceae bacterium]
MQKLLFPVFLILFLSSACSKSSDDNSNSNTNDPQVTTGVWKVSYYYDKDKEETGDFKDHTFEFQAGGTLIAHLPDGSTKNGTWSTGSTKFNIVIGGTYALDEMADDWLLIEKTDNLIRLQDDNSSHLEELHFVKI